MDDRPTLELVFQLSLSLKMWHRFTEVPPKKVDRNESGSLNDVYRHLQEKLGLRCGEEYSLLPIAVCHTSSSSSVELSQPPSSEDAGYRWVPLVTDQIWKKLLRTYCRPVVKVVVESRPSIDESLPRCRSFPMRMKSRQLKCIDAGHYIPSKLKRSNIVKICEKIMWEDYTIAPKLRRGLWMHLLGVFHPRMETHEQRASFVQKLRRIYEDLKAKVVDRSQWLPEIQQLYQSIRCDAVRTDPGEKFLAENPEKLDILEQVTLIYALEHKEVKYTQGMTDLLSPILYVMEKEEDAYICLCALFGRIKENFDEWCKGTLNRMERLRHLCEVLDPQLFCYLTSDLVDDPFVLFFGMILVQCRREFTFAESLHLFEVLCAASFFREPDVSDVSDLDWAQFMTSESPETIGQVFGGDTSPYSVKPLGNSFTRATTASTGEHARSPPFVASQRVSTSAAGLRGGIPPLMEERTVSLASHSRNSVSAPCWTAVLDDGDQGSRIQTPELGPANASISKRPTEMSDMSSISSCNTTNGHGHPNTTPTLQPKTVSSATPDANLSSQESIVGPSPIKELMLQGANPQHLEMDVKETAVPTAETDAAVHSPSMEEMFPLENGIHLDQPVAGNPDLRTGDSERNSGNWKNKEVALSPVVVCKTRHSQPASSLLSPSSPPQTSTHGMPSDCTIVGDADSGSGESDELVEHNSRNGNKEGTLSPTVDCWTEPFQPTSSFPSASTLPLHLSGGYLRTERGPFRSPVLARRSGTFSSSLPSLDLAGSAHRNYRYPAALSPGWNSSLPFQGVMHQLSGSRQHSLEISIEVSQVLSQALIPDLATHETSLSVHMSDAFSLFICLAILISKRKAILKNRLDFVNLSMLLNAREYGHNLDHILPLARSLCRMYSDLQQTYFGDLTAFPRERWLDADTSDAAESRPLETPPIHVPQPRSSSSDVPSDV